MPKLQQITSNKDNMEVTIFVSQETVQGEYKFTSASGTVSISFKATVLEGKREIPVDSVSVLPSAVTLALGGSVDLTAIVSPSNATGDNTVSWSVESSSDKISVANTGEVTVSADASKGAETVITATAGGKSGT